VAAYSSLSLIKIFDRALGRSPAGLLVCSPRGGAVEQLSRRRWGQTPEPLQFHYRFETLGGRSRDVFSVLELGVHDHSEDLDVVLGPNSLSLDHKGLCVALVRFAGEVYDCRLLRLKSRPASSLPVQSVLNDGFDAFAVALRRRSSNLRREVVHEGYRAPAAIDSSLYQVGIEEEEKDRRQGRALW